MGTGSLTQAGGFMVWVILEALIRTGDNRCGTTYLSLLKTGAVIGR